jgi:hypothetical protein
MTGRIHAITGKTITIQEEGPESACFGCLNQECGTRPRFFTVENTLELSLSIGQFIETGASKRGLVSQAFSALVPPLVAFVAGFALIGACFPLLGEGTRAAGGAVCLFVAAGITYFVRERVPAKDKPLVVRVL